MLLYVRPHIGKVYIEQHIRVNNTDKSHVTQSHKFNNLFSFKVRTNLVYKNNC